jgi:2-amino-4-hydroxy-6-hydroxymethyldihydropteridine diphosphokinase
MADVLIALGANLGDRADTLTRAIERLRAQPGFCRLRASGFHETLPIGGPSDQPGFLNAAARFETDLAPEGVHAALLEIEASCGRVRAERWAARTLDLDLLLYDDLEVNLTGLLIPHPRMTFRRFVLEPATEIAGEMIHPSTTWPLARLLEHLNTAVAYVAILAAPESGPSDFAQEIAAACGGTAILDESPLHGPDVADSPSQVFKRQIEFLSRARVQLARHRWPADAPLVVSDFYFDQLLAYAEQLPGDYAVKIEQAWATAHREIVRPKLVVVLDDLPGPGQFKKVRSSANEPGERLRAAMVRLARRKNLGPTLFAGRKPGRSQFGEVLAAIQAMG